MLKLTTDKHEASRGISATAELLVKVTMVKFGLRVRALEYLPHVKFCRNRLRGYTHLWKIYTKNYQFWRFSRISSHF